MMSWRWTVCLAVAALSLTLWGCKRQETTVAGLPETAATEAPSPAPAETPSEAPQEQPSEAPETTAPAPPPTPSGGPSGGGTIQGVVKFAGTPPAPRPINFAAEKQCAALHGDQVAYYEDLVVNPNGTLKWAFVYLKEVSGNFPAPSEPLVVDQHGCIFKPHVMGVMVGQPVEFLNSDPLLHNVRAMSKQGQSFNVAQPTQGMKHTETFKTAEMGILLRCDVHPWMSAYLHVMPHPFFAVTGEDGKFTLSNVPPGTYTLVAWHEKLKTQEQQVTVQAGQTTSVEFTFSKP